MFSIINLLKYRIRGGFCIKMWYNYINKMMFLKCKVIRNIKINLVGVNKFIYLSFVVVFFNV